MTYYYNGGGTPQSTASSKLFAAMFLGGFPDDTGFVDITDGGYVVNKDPYWRMGGAGGAQTIEFGLYNDYRIEIDQANGIRAWNGSSWINLLTVSNYINPIEWVGIDGFFQSDTFWQVLHSDVDAKIFFDFVCPETRTDWKILFVMASDSTTGTVTASGKVKVATGGDGEAWGGTILLNLVNHDIVNIPNGYVFHHSTTTTFSLTKGDHIDGYWIKDDNSGGAASSLYVNGIHLIH